MADPHLAPRPPIGWNSWNSFATTIAEAQACEIASIMRERLLRFAYAAAALALASPSGDRHARLAALEQVAAERRRRRDRLLALRREVAEALAELPSLESKGWHVRRALTEKKEWVGPAVAQASRLVARSIANRRTSGKNARSLSSTRR